jgi:hypothetical protein
MEANHEVLQLATELNDMKTEREQETDREVTHLIVKISEVTEQFHK